jgi:DNA-binding transcriptional regulator YdaS (Cro superfamily)
MAEMSGIERAVEVQGSQAALAAALGRTQQAVSLWIQQGYAPAGLVPRIAELTGVAARDLLDPKLAQLAEG